ncbi:MAG: hypothetical protein PHE67_00725 [Campylobacterales bacterium]|nr:hypothetical protein [Campylobacterales bacterium]
MHKQLKHLICVFLCGCLLSQPVALRAASNPTTSERLDWNLIETNTSISDKPSNLKYFQYFDVLPDNITSQVYKNLDASNMAGKQLYIGYGIANPDDKDCRFFPDLNRTECFPWWRIEREYNIPTSVGSGSISFIKGLPLMYPPKSVDYCKTWKTAEYDAGGQVTCVSYYDMTKSVDCLANPEQSQCFVDLCSDKIKSKCSLAGKVDGDVTTLPAIVGKPGENISQSSTKVSLKTSQYNCPGGYLPLKECQEWLYGAMYPYECKPNSSPTSNDGVYLYCNNDRTPVFDTNNNLIGFSSSDKCPDGRVMDGSVGSNGIRQLCPIDNYTQTQKVCEDPIYQAETNTTSQTITQTRVSHDYTSNVLFGDESNDPYSTNPLCLRLNTVEGARNKTLSVRIVGSGYIDDDIYVLRHQEGNDVTKVYCNMQHDSESNSLRAWNYTYSGYHSTGVKTITVKMTDNNGIVTTSVKNTTVVNNGAVSTSSDIPTQVNKDASFNINWQSSLSIVKLEIDFGSGYVQVTNMVDNTTSLATKNYNGTTLMCERNAGSYSFDSTMTILSSDIVSVQQNSEWEANNGAPFSVGRNHYYSTAVTIDGVLVAPTTFPAQFPYYPGGNYLQTWDNTTATLSLLFPFAGSYDVFFYGGSNEYDNNLMSKATLTTNDFKQIGDGVPLQLKLATNMTKSANIPNDSKACLDDDWVEWGGGVFGGRKSKTGEPCYSPDDNYVVNNSVYKIIIKDLLTGTITPIPLVYPLPYPNRVFISKLNVLENRKYRCFEQFPDLNLSGNCSIYSQNENTPISDYRGMSVNQKRDTTISCETTTQKLVGCNKEKTVINSQNMKYGTYNEYQTNDYSKAFMDGLNQAKLAESMLHIWSGWPGECEHGTFTDFSWTKDPMTLASLAMSAYSSMNAGADAANKSMEASGEEYSKAQDSYNAASAAGDTTAALAAQQTMASAAAQIQESASSLSLMLKNMIDNGIDSVISSLTTSAKSYSDAATAALNDLATGTNTASSGLQTTNVIQELGKTYSETIGSIGDMVVDTYKNATDYTYNVSDAIKNTESTIANMNNAIIAADNAASVATNAGDLAEAARQLAVKSSLEQGLIEQTTRLQALQSSVTGQIVGATQTATTTLKEALTGSGSSATAAQKAISSYVTDANAMMKSAQDMANDIYKRYKDFANLELIEGYSTITWQNIASATLTGYSQLAAKQDELIKAYKSQVAYVMSGEGTINDVNANAYATCMASLGATFVNTISRSIGANDENTTSAELLTPWKNPLRISFLSLIDLRSAVGQTFVDSNYLVKDVDYNIQMLTIVALNSQAYTQLTQIVCGGYITSVTANTMNAAAASSSGGGDTSLLGALGAMDTAQKVKMAASIACSFAGPYAFVCSLAMKFISSFSSGDACNDEKKAMSQKPIMLKTNKFQKFSQCHHTGSECAEKWFLVGCIRQREKYCCYDQITTRIYAEGVKEERAMGWDSCNDITINDLQYISFVPCKPGQDPHNDRCFPLAKYQELGVELKKQISKGVAGDSDSLMKQVQNAMELAQ